jgi:hypothetical protein
VENGISATLPEGSVGIKSALLPGNDEWAYARNTGEADMTHSDRIRAEVQGPDIFVAMRGTCLRMKYRKEDAPWLIAREYGPEDPDAPVTLSEFRALAWQQLTLKHAS